jgi:hypothetical protein
MRGALAGAWLASTGLVIWRQLHGNPHLPVPGTLLAVTGIFGLLAVAGDVAPAARPVITLGAWGIVVAGVLNLWPAGLGAEAQATAASGTGATQPAPQPT